MNSELGQLIRLQEADLRIAELTQRIQELPAEIEDLQHLLEESRQKVENSNHVLEETRSNRKRLESEVDDLKQKLAKYKTQLMEVKSNREYQAMLHEIAGVEKEIGSREDEILESMLEADDVAEKIANASRELKSKESEIAGQRQELEAAIVEAEQEIQSRSTEKEGLIKKIQKGLMADYQRIASIRNGQALAEAREQSCQACHVRLRPQFFAELKVGESIFRCESCSRILYFVPVPEKAAKTASSSAAG